MGRHVEATPAEKAAQLDRSAAELETRARQLRDHALALRVGALHSEPREGEPVVRIRSTVEYGLQTDTDEHEVDAEWWAALNDRDRDEYLAATAVNDQNNAAPCGASVVGDDDGEEDDPE